MGLFPVAEALRGWRGYRLLQKAGVPDSGQGSPFYALKVGPALLTVTGGLKTDINFECLDADGKPIEGLYALGNCMGDITAVDYPINVAGNSHGRCITYGYLLGKDLAK